MNIHRNCKHEHGNLMHQEAFDTQCVWTDGDARENVERTHKSGAGHNTGRRGTMQLSLYRHFLILAANRQAAAGCGASVSGRLRLYTWDRR